MQALGLIEVIGYPAAIEAADACMKAANVRLGGITKVGSGIVTVQIFGDVGAVKAAVDAGGKAAEKVGKVRATHVIPRADSAVFNIVKLPSSKKTNNDQLSSMGRGSNGNIQADVSTGETRAQESYGLSQNQSSTVNALQTVDPDEPIGERAEPIANADVSADGTIDTVEPVMENSESTETTDKPTEVTDEPKATPSESNESKGELGDNGSLPIDTQGATGFTEEQLYAKTNSELRAIISQLGIKQEMSQLRNVNKKQLVQIILKNDQVRKGEI